MMLLKGLVAATPVPIIFSELLASLLAPTFVPRIIFEFLTFRVVLLLLFRRGFLIGHLLRQLVRLRNTPKVAKLGMFGKQYAVNRPILMSTHQETCDTIFTFAQQLYEKDRVDATIVRKLHVHYVTLVAPLRTQPSSFVFVTP